MREIKFRAIATEDYQTSTDGIEKGEFVYGYYYFCKRRMSGIIVTELEEESGGVGSGLVQVEIEVDYKTVGQCICLEDKNGKEIYKGDIVQGDKKDFHTKYIEKVDVDLINGSIWKESELENGKIIGNIYENPNLLKQKE